MARTVLVKTTAVGKYSDVGVDVTLAAADVPNKNRFICTGRELVIARNSDPANPYTVTITSVADRFGRTRDITAFSLAATDVSIFGPFPRNGWQQPDGYVYLEASNAAILLGVIDLGLEVPE